MSSLNWDSANVLIAGGAGFIGSHFVEKLSARVNHLSIYDKLTHKKVGFNFNGKSNVSLIEGDMTDSDRLDKAMVGKTLAIHLAANSDIARSAQEPDLDFNNGQISTYNLLKAIRKNKVPYLVYFSGSGVYGDRAEFFDESYGPLLPVSPYGASKLGSEAWISAFSNMYNIRSWIFRPANVVGERQTHGVAFDFVKKLKRDPTKLEIHGNGKQTKSYVYIEDVVSGVLSAFNVTPDPVSIYNIASEDLIAVDEIADIVVGEMGLHDVQYVHSGGIIGWKGDVSVIRLSIDKLKKTGWRPRFTSRESIKRATAWLVNNLS